MEPVSTMSAILTTVTSVVTAAVGWMGQYAEVIASNDILVLTVVAVPIVGLGVGILKRMISL